MNIALDKTRLTLMSLIACLACLALAGPANAGLLVESASDCDDAPLERPFTRWLDPMQYGLAPNGGFEAGTAQWSLANATVVAGNESFDVGGDADSRSLKIPAGGSATTAPVCVGLAYPTLRFFTKSSAGLLSLSTLRVDVLFNGSDGRTHSLPIGVATASRSWQPTLPMVIVANLLPILDGERTAVRFRFTPQGSASWQIDDVYVDPMRRGG